ncbi:MAG: cell division protein FtsA [Lentisphaerae bacterium]|nr:cell division protein FtsA [Lentisphaerota bacterium]
MFQKRNTVCAIEFGTSKVCVLIGEVGTRGGVGAIIGHGMAYLPGAVIKGEIADMDRATKALNKALSEADRSSGGELVNCRMMTLLVSGCGIESRQAKGIVTVKNSDGVITDAEKAEANENAKVIALGSGREIINTSVSYYLVDNRRVSNPLGQSGRRLEAYVHIIHAVASRVDNFRRAVINSGVENARIEPVFSPLAAGIGIVGELEKENGSLLIDLGAGATEYLVYFDRGVCASGVVQLGMEHVANDLAIGLNLHIDSCRKLLGSGMLENALKEKRAFLEFPGPGGRMKNIPLSAFEMIVDARLREIFELVRSQLREKNAPRALGAGGVLTGGGAEYFRSRELFSDVFDLDCRIGLPADAGGAGTDLTSPRFSALWGALKVAAFFQQSYGISPEGGLKKVFGKMGKFLGRGDR